MSLSVIPRYNSLLRVFTLLQHPAAVNTLNENMLTTVRNSTDDKLKVFGINDLHSAEGALCVRHVEAVFLCHNTSGYTCEKVKLCCSCLQHFGWLKFDDNQEPQLSVMTIKLQYISARSPEKLNENKP